MVLWELIVAGALGGLARSIYGALKVVGSKTLHLWYFLITIVVASILGSIVGLIFGTGNAVSALTGYVGTDILENVFVGVLPKSLTIKAK